VTAIGRVWFRGLRGYDECGSGSSEGFAASSTGAEHLVRRSGGKVPLKLNAPSNYISLFSLNFNIF